MRVLITGAAGFLGINLVRRFACQGAHVSALARSHPDAESLAFLADCRGQVRWHLGDVTDREDMASLLAKVEPDVLVHAAAATATGEQELERPTMVFDVNTGGTLNLLDAARMTGLQRFVYISSGGLYGPAPPLPVLSEDAPLLPRNMYAVSKISSEMLARRYSELFGLNAITARVGTVYGPMERSTGSRSSVSVIESAIRLAERASSRQVRVCGADIARDFCHVFDVADAIHRLSTYDELRHVVYNVGSPVAESFSVALKALAGQFADFSWCVADEEGADLVQTAGNARAGMDLSRISRDTGWTPRFGLAEGVRTYVRWRS